MERMRIGMIGRGFVSKLHHEGWARVQGETWRVRSGAKVRRGQRLRVRAIDGLIRTVEVDA